MKKLSALVLALCLILSAFALASCGNESQNPADGTGSSTDAAVSDSSNTNGGDDSSSDSEGGNNEASLYQTVAAAIAKTLGAKAYDANIETLLKTTLMGNVYPENGKNINVKASALDTAPAILVSGQAKYEGDEAPYNFYFDGAWKYMIADQYKMETSLEEFAKEIGAPQSIIVALPEALFANVEGTENADGSLSVTLAVDDATMKTIYKDDITAIVYDIVGDNISPVSIKDATVTLTVVNGYIGSYEVSFVCEYAVGKDTVVYEASRSVDFVSCDGAVTVTPPANLDSFNEIDWG